jgi:hypothetical protein
LGSNQQQLKDDFDMKMGAFIRTFTGQAWQAAQPSKADTRLKKSKTSFFSLQDAPGSLS